MSAPEEMAAPEETVATGTIAVSESRPIREYLSRTEVAEAIRSLTDAEKTKLMKYARIQAAKTPYDGEDLFQEALTRCLEEGRRPWPRDVSVLGFLAGVTKSIASEWKDDLSPDPIGEPSSGDEELKAIARIDTDKVIKLFDDDLIAQSIIISKIFGARGEELRKVSVGGEFMTDDQSRRRDALDNLTDALCEDILKAPGEELLAEVGEDYGDRRALAMGFDRIFARVQQDSGRLDALAELDE
jgi:hypothetical protein